MVCALSVGTGVLPVPGFLLASSRPGSRLHLMAALLACRSKVPRRHSMACYRMKCRNRVWKKAGRTPWEGIMGMGGPQSMATSGWVLPGGDPALLAGCGTQSCKQSACCGLCWGWVGELAIAVTRTSAGRYSSWCCCCKGGSEGALSGGSELPLVHAWWVPHVAAGWCGSVVQSSGELTMPRRKYSFVFRPFLLLPQLSARREEWVGTCCVWWVEWEGRPLLPAAAHGYNIVGVSQKHHLGWQFTTLPVNHLRQLKSKYYKHWINSRSGNKSGGVTA